MDWDDEVDFLSIGSGAGGVTAALTAGRDGFSAMVVEKDSWLGGVTAYSAGQVWLGVTPFTRAAGVPDTDGSAYLDFLGAGYAEPAMRDAYIRGGMQMLDFLSEVGVRLELVDGLPDYFYPDAPGSVAQGRALEVAPFPLSELGPLAHRLYIPADGTGQKRSTDLTAGLTGARIAAVGRERAQQGLVSAGSGLMASLISAARRRGVGFEAETECVELVRERGRVAGAVCTASPGPRRIRARYGVLLAMSGYDWNPVLVKRHEHLDSLGSMAPRTVTGDHFAIAGAIGAAIASFPSWSSPLHTGYVVSRGPAGDNYQSLLAGAPHSLIVNRAGQRFGDESFYPAFEAALSEFDGLMRQPRNWPAWIVFDEAFRRHYVSIQAGSKMPGTGLPDEDVITAADLGELGARAGIAPDGLRATIARFNGFCRDGVDPDFGRGRMPWSRIMMGDPAVAPNPLLGAIDEAPFHAMPLLRVGMGIASSGLLTNEAGQVLDTHGEAIPGLYSAGNSSARIDVGAGYNSGIAVARGLVYGHLAARHACRRD